MKPGEDESGEGRAIRLNSWDEAVDRECIETAIRRAGRATMRLEVVMDVTGRRDWDGRWRNWRFRLGGGCKMSFTDAEAALGFLRELRENLRSSPYSKARFGTVQEGSVISDEKSTVSK